MKIGVMLSGGVDSAVALATLKEEGHRIVAYHMKTMPDEFFVNREIKHKVCCSPSDTLDAKIIANQFGVPLKIVNLHEVFHEKIITYFLNEYKSGRTPNPCFMCNQKIKFGYLMDLMLADGMDMVASGHYARIIDGKLYKAIDKERDQSYFLASVERHRLEKIIFPNGDKTKEQVREIAKKYSIHVHSKKDSQDLCFIPDGDHERFFIEHGVQVKPGPIFDKYGRKIGEHKGLIHYTIGQRKLGISVGERLYVKRLCAERNAVIVGTLEDVKSDKFIVKDLNLLIDCPKRFKATVKIRRNFNEESCEVEITNNVAVVKTEKPLFAVTPGQAAVFYDGDLVIGGGIIDSVL
nr:tRNA 2-thiouridine(34) synthase MnmA [Pseudothermotoga thermarum]